MSGLQESIAFIDFKEVNLNAHFLYPFYVFPSLKSQRMLRIIVILLELQLITKLIHSEGMGMCQILFSLIGPI